MSAASGVENATDQTEGARPMAYPRPARAWYMVSLLTIAYVVSFVDRNILGLLIDPIKADLELSDFQIGLLLGPAFAIFYATMGLPLGYLADRKRRTWIVAAGITLWSAATALSGLARNFGQLFVARMSVGVGEATLSPCAMSLISDSYPEERRGKPIAFYSSAISLGMGLASLLGAAVLAWVGSGNTIDWPLLGPLAGWQTAFLVVGLPGVVLGALFLFVREPQRIDTAAGGHLGHMFAHVARHGAVFATFLSVFCVMTIIAYSHGWLAVTFARTWGWSVEEFALANGIALVIVGPLSVNLAGALSDRFTSRGHRDAPMRIALYGLALGVPPCVIGPLLDNAWAAFSLLTLGNAGLAFVTATSVTALLPIAPPRIRAQVVAFYYMAISLAGLMLGPTLVGALNDMVFGVDGVRYSVALLPLLFGGPVLALAPVTLRLYRRALEQDIGETG
ncbi:MAG: MFS transporter [Gammaproteobacteria bacterium]|nr:MFS transporter [Gammaproteobacteria bacterium]MYB37376.1 MFS transporter [Gammaproteobacteria bacterium]